MQIKDPGGTILRVTGRSQVLILSSLVAVLMVSVACGDEDPAGQGGVPSGTEENHPEAEKQLLTASGPLLVWRADKIDSDIGMLSVVDGTLILRDGCAYLRDSEADYLVVWPSGSRWSEVGQAVELADGSLVRVNDQVSGGGGHLNLELSVPAVISADVERLAGKCTGPRSGEVAVFNAFGEVEVT